MASANIVMLTEDNFRAEVLQSDKPVLVDFWAAWCGPCKMIAPLIDELADDYAGKAKSLQTECRRLRQNCPVLRRYEYPNADCVQRRSGSKQNCRLPSESRNRQIVGSLRLSPMQMRTLVVRFFLLRPLWR